MRIGAPVFGWKDPESWARAHVQAGYGAAYWPTRQAPWGSDQVEAYLEAARRHGLVIAEVGVWRNLLERDEAQREANIRYAMDCLRLADQVGARCCVNTAGTLSTAHWYGPHPDNLSPETLRQVAAVIRRILETVRPRRTFYTVEPMAWLYPYDEDSTRALIQAVDHPAFGVHVDMCNLVNDYHKVYRTGDITRAYFAAFAPLIRSVHAKDTLLTAELTLCVRETIPGQGVFDHDALLTACNGLDPDLPVMCEHLDTPEMYRQATDFLFERCRALGITPRQGR